MCWCSPCYESYLSVIFPVFDALLENDIPEDPFSYVYKSVS